MSIKRFPSGSAYEPKSAIAGRWWLDGWVMIAGTTGNDHATMTTPESVLDQCELALGHIRAALGKRWGIDGGCGAS